LLLHWLRDPPPLPGDWGDRILRLVLATPLLWWLYNTVESLAWRQQSANSSIWEGIPDDLLQAEAFSLQVNIAVAVLGLAVIALWRWQPQIARILLAVFAAGILFVGFSFCNVLSHSRI
jgi:hypothetical protein